VPPTVSAPASARSLEQLTVVCAGVLAPDQLPSLVDGLAAQYAYVVAWTRSDRRGDFAPLIGPGDRVLIAVPSALCRQADRRAWLPPVSAGTELVVLAAPEPRSVATSEAIAAEMGVPVAALLPDTPPALETQDAPADWVLRHPESPFAQAVARLARRLVGKSVGLALGAGAGRGHAHIGVLRALERLGIRPDFLAGVSIGACVAGLYACGVPFHEMDLVLQRLGRLICRRTFPLYSLMTGAGLDRAIRSAVSPGIQIEDISFPCAVVAADLRTGEEVVLRRGSGWESVRASATIPGVFPPARLDGRLLVDGGVVNPVPCRTLREMGADVVLGVSLETDLRRGPSGPAMDGRTPTWPAALLRALDLLQQSLTERALQDADVPLRVFTPAIRLTDFRGGLEFLEAGERAVAAAQDRLRTLLPWTR
jgi:NTE family protein